jgi:hypothetical protein
MLQSVIKLCCYHDSARSGGTCHSVLVEDGADTVDPKATICRVATEEGVVLVRFATSSSN